MTDIKEIKSINDLAVFLKKNGNRLKPLEPSEISIIESKFEVRLPIVYKRFLTLMGRGAGDYMLGSSVFFDELFSLRDGAIELLQENHMDSLPEEAFVFWLHQGYQVAYFKLDDGDDPPIYYFSEGQNDKVFELKEKCLTDFFISQLYLNPKSSIELWG
ncbi:MAG: SMI1/KNR4 family protein [Flavobacterium sp.]|nr:SMI1/KNR4 family protein [Flavobacterium sp.]